MGAETKTPRHVAIIMDGNGRWAQQRGHDRIEGHMKGVESVREAIGSSIRHGVRYLTLYVFSAENWGRPATEVDALMELLCRCVINETDELVRQGVRVRIIGEREGMPDNVREQLEVIEESTKDGSVLTVLLALNYGSRNEITRAVGNIARAVKEGRLSVDGITAATVEDNLYTAEYPDPDLLIRTGGDYRLSNFLLWQAAYSEFYFTPEYWPDFDASSYDRAVEAYGLRERRYGLTSKQIQYIKDEK